MPSEHNGLPAIPSQRKQDSRLCISGSSRLYWEALPQWVQWKSNGGWLPESVLMLTSSSYNTDRKTWATLCSSSSPSSTSLYPLSSDLFSCLTLGTQGPLQPREPESGIPKHNVTLTSSQFTSHRPSPSMGLHFYPQQQVHGVTAVSHVTPRCWRQQGSSIPTFKGQLEKIKSKFKISVEFVRCQ